MTVITLTVFIGLITYREINSCTKLIDDIQAEPHYIFSLVHYSKLGITQTTVINDLNKPRNANKEKIENISATKLKQNMFDCGHDRRKDFRSFIKRNKANSTANTSV